MKTLIKGTSKTGILCVSVFDLFIATIVSDLSLNIIKLYVWYQLNWKVFHPETDTFLAV